MNITFSTGHLAALHTLLADEIETQRENVYDACRSDPEFLCIAAEAYTAYYRLTACFYEEDGTTKIEEGPREIALTDDQLVLAVEMVEIAHDMTKDELETPPTDFETANWYGILGGLLGFLRGVAAAHGVEVG